MKVNAMIFLSANIYNGYSANTDFFLVLAEFLLMSMGDDTVTMDSVRTDLSERFSFRNQKNYRRKDCGQPAYTGSPEKQLIMPRYIYCYTVNSYTSQQHTARTAQNMNTISSTWRTC